MYGSIRPVVVATDDSPHADDVVEWAADDAARRGLPLHIVHAAERRMNDIRRYPASGMRGSPGQASHKILTAAQKIAVARRPGLTVTTESVQGTPPHALREVSKRAFEMVLGHRRLGGFGSLLLGSTSLRVAGYAACPVIIIRGESVRTDGYVVVGIDLDHDNDPVLEYAFGAASVRGERLQVTHTFLLNDPFVVDDHVLQVDSIKRSLDQRLTRMLAPWRERFPGVRVTRKLVREHPVTTLSEASRREDLVVVGSHGRGIIEGAFFGSVSHRLIRHAHGPVAVVRSAREEPSQGSRRRSP